MRQIAQNSKTNSHRLATKAWAGKCQSVIWRFFTTKRIIFGLPTTRELTDSFAGVAFRFDTQRSR
jgi:hypothetical protein